MLYRLKDDSVQLKARCVLINTITREMVTLTEQVPADAPELFEGLDRFPEILIGLVPEELREAPERSR